MKLVLDAFWRVNSDWILSTENARHGKREERAKYTLASTPWDWMSIMCSMLRLTDSILVEVASLEVERNDHFESDPPRPLSILCCEDCGEIHIREAGVKKGGSVEGDGQRITEDS
jgi:hypothetical protein